MIFGAISTLTLISYPEGSFALWWVNLLGYLTGWGIYPLAIGSMILGVWVLLRNKPYVPQLSAQRVIGGFLLSLNLVTWFHLFAGGTREVIPTGDGGGYIGLWFIECLIVHVRGRRCDHHHDRLVPARVASDPERIDRPDRQLAE